MAKKKIKKDKNIPVLLLEDIAQVGNRGEVKKVSRGFALHLWRKGQVIIITPENKDKLDKLIQATEEKLAKKQKELETLKEKIENLVFKTTIKVGPHGEVYNSVNKIQIKKFLETNNIFINKEDIDLSEPIKAAGEYVIEINLGLNIKAKLKIIVEPSK